MYFYFTDAKINNLLSNKYKAGLSLALCRAVQSLGKEKKISICWILIAGDNLLTRYLL